jgi:hypothetical protein
MDLNELDVNRIVIPFFVSLIILAILKQLEKRKKLSFRLDDAVCGSQSANRLSRLKESVVSFSWKKQPCVAAVADDKIEEPKSKIEGDVTKHKRDLFRRQRHDQFNSMENCSLIQQHARMHELQNILMEERGLLKRGNLIVLAWRRTRLFIKYTGSSDVSTFQLWQSRNRETKQLVVLPGSVEQKNKSNEWWFCDTMGRWHVFRSASVKAASRWCAVITTMTGAPSGKIIVETPGVDSIASHVCRQMPAPVCTTQP